MNKLTYRLMSVIAVFVLMLGNSYSAGASAANGASQAATTIPAFPGAEGFGANSIGGRGGTIYEVTNLNDAGAGSLRACVEASGPRTCVFRTGGLITLNSQLTISNPYITIAGQTAPGGGITLKKSAGGNVFATQTHDVVIRYITSRPGPGGENHANQIAKNGTELYNIIIDHNSLSWGVDLNIETWYRVQAATIQWSLISEALDNSTHSKGAHSKGLMIGGYQGSEFGGKGTENISVLNNLMAHNGERNPLMQMCGIGQVINNTTYNPFWTFSHQQLNCPSGESYVNWINNYHKKGPSSTSNSDLKVIPSGSGVWSPGKVYVKGNIGPSRSNDTLPETNWVEVKAGAPAGVIVTSPAPAPAVNSTTAMEAYNRVIAEGGVGNSRGLSCDGSWYNRRDSIDVRVINDVKAGTGKIIDDPSQVGGWITPAAGVPCTDSDHDGMPDAWELGNGFNPNISDGSADKDADGYTNVEEYLNGTNSVSIPGITPTSTLPVATITTATKPIKGDFDGNGLDEVGVFSSGNGTWSINGMSPLVYGQNGDTPVVADYNGDGKDDIAVFRPTTSTWYIYGIGSFVYGNVGDIPVVADYNGDSKADIAVFRPTNHTWYLYGMDPFVYGTVGDIPVIADYNGDGKADIAVFRPTNSTWYLYGIGPRVYGTVGDIPAIADYNGDGKADIAVFRPSSSTWYVYGIGPSVFGTVGDTPVIGDYTGDGKADITVFRPSNSLFYIRGVGLIDY